MFSLLLLLQVPCLARLPPRWSCAGLRLSKIFRKSANRSFLPCFAGCKDTAFIITSNKKIIIFLKLSYIIDSQIYKYYKSMNNGWGSDAFCYFIETENSVLVGLYEFNGANNDKICENGFGFSFADMRQFLKFR